MNVGSLSSQDKVVHNVRDHLEIRVRGNSKGLLLILKYNVRSDGKKSDSTTSCLCCQCGGSRFGLITLRHRILLSCRVDRPLM